MFLLQAAEGGTSLFPAFVGIVLIVGAILAIYWRNTHCPNCKRIFTRETTKKEKAGLLPTAISGKERRHYRCKHCGTEWDATHYVN
jgi:transposase-like protein